MAIFNRFIDETTFNDWVRSSGIGEYICYVQETDSIKKSNVRIKI